MALELRDGRFKPMPLPGNLSDNFIARLLRTVSSNPAGAKGTGSILATIFGAPPEVLGFFGQSGMPTSSTNQSVSTQPPSNAPIYIGIGLGVLALTGVYIYTKKK